MDYTNAAFIVKEGFKLPEDGLYSGFDATTQIYDKSTWNYQEGGNMTPAAAGTKPAPGANSGANATEQHQASQQAAGTSSKRGVFASRRASARWRVQRDTSGGQGPLGGGHQAAGGPGASGQGGPNPPPMLPPNVAYDLSLQHPRSVFQLLKKQYSRYTPEMVERITGIPRDQFIKAADLFTSIRKDGDMKKAATIIYAVGWTQHTFGTQIIRTAAMLQLLLATSGERAAA